MIGDFAGVPRRVRRQLPLLGLAPLVLAALLLVSCGKRVGVAPTDGPSPPAYPPSLVHTVREGETLARIADLYYGDPARAARVAADNGIAADTVLGAGSVLHLRFAPREFEQARRRAFALEPYNRGVAAMAAGDHDEAERQFRIALQTVPDLVDARYNLALILLRRGRAEPAAESLAGLVRERPDDADIGFALGNALFQQTRFAEAAAAFAAVLAGDPDHRRAAFGHARALQAAGQERAAAGAWRRYLELDGTSSWAGEARRHLRELTGG